jgi:phosphopantetheinyl transferase (holo-ACP synthase)
MIIGIGSDIIDIRRIEETLARFGERFTNRIYTEKERARAERRPNSAPQPTLSASRPRKRPRKLWVQG